MEVKMKRFLSIFLLLILTATFQQQIKAGLTFSTPVNQQELLLTAVRKDNVTDINTAIFNGANPLKTYDTEQNLIHVASEHGSIEALKLILTKIEPGKLKVGGYSTLPIMKTGKYLEIEFNFIKDKSDDLKIELISYRINADPIKKRMVTLITKDVQFEKPGSCLLYQNFPNPFNSRTQIQFTLTVQSFVTINVYDIAGHLVCNLMSEDKSAGDFSIVWDGKNNNDVTVTNGLYVCCMTSNNIKIIKKMLLLK